MITYIHLRWRRGSWAEFEGRDMEGLEEGKGKGKMMYTLIKTLIKLSKLWDAFLMELADLSNNLSLSHSETAPVRPAVLSS